MWVFVAAHIRATLAVREGLLNCLRSGQKQRRRNATSALSHRQTSPDRPGLSGLCHWRSFRQARDPESLCQSLDIFRPSKGGNVLDSGNA